MNNYTLNNLFGAIHKNANVCFSPDGTILYSACGNRLHSTNLHNHTTTTLTVETFTPIVYIAVDCRHSIILLIDQTNHGTFVSTATQTVISTHNFHDTITSIKFSPTEPLVAVGYEKKLEVWRVPVLTKSVGFTPTMKWNKLTIAGCVVDNKLLLVASTGAVGEFHYDKTEKNFILASRHYVGEVKRRIASANFGGNVLACCLGNDVAIYEIENFSKLHEYASTDNRSRVVVSSDGSVIALGNADRDYLRVYQWKTETYLLKISGHTSPVISTAISPNGLHVATGAEDGIICLWDINGTAYAEFSFKQEGDVGSDAAVRGLAFTPNSLAVVAVGGGGKIRVFDLIKKKCFRAFRAETSRLDAVVVEKRDGDMIICADYENAVIFVFSLRSGKLLDKISGHEGPITGICLNPGTTEIITSSWDGTCRVVDVLNGGSAESLSHPAEVLAVDINSASTIIATACRDGYVYLWGAEDKEMIGLIAYRNDFVGGVVIAGDGAVESNSGGNRRQKYANSVRFLRDDDEVLVIGGNSKFVNYYNIVSKNLLRKMKISRDYSYANLYDYAHSKTLIQNFASKKSREIYTKSIVVGDAGKTLGILTNAGFQLYTADTSAFQPYALTEAITPDATVAASDRGDYISALTFALHIGEENLINMIFRGIPSSEISVLLPFLEKEVRGLLFHRAIFFTAVLIKSHAGSLLKRNVSLTQTAIPAQVMFDAQLRNLLKAISSVYKNLSDQSTKTLALLDLCLVDNKFFEKKEMAMDVEIKEDSDENAMEMA
ncbi:WD-repeat protein [Entamoeba marina]